MHVVSNRRSLHTAAVWFLAGILLCACSAKTPAGDPGLTKEQQAREREAQRLRELGLLFPKGMTRDQLSRRLRPRTPGALISDQDRTVVCRGLRLEFDPFGNLTRIDLEEGTR